MSAAGLTSRKITDLLCGCQWTPRRHVLVPNVSFGLLSWEADLLVMFDSLWCEEVEIKISRVDFKREFQEKWRKHEILSGRMEATPYERLPRRYWMAFPLDLAEALLPEVPEYAGVIGVGGGCLVLRPAPLLKCGRKLTEKEARQLLRLAHLRYWDMRKKGREEANERLQTR